MLNPFKDLKGYHITRYILSLKFISIVPYDINVCLLLIIVSFIILICLKCGLCGAILHGCSRSHRVMNQTVNYSYWAQYAH